MDKFTELKDDIAYKKLDEKYPYCQLDFVILAFHGEYKDVITHKEAILKAFDIFSNRHRVGNRINPPKFKVYEEKMICTKITFNELFSENKCIHDDVINKKIIFVHSLIRPTEHRILLRISANLTICCSPNIFGMIWRFIAGTTIFPTISTTARNGGVRLSSAFSTRHSNAL